MNVLVVVVVYRLQPRHSHRAAFFVHRRAFFWDTLPEQSKCDNEHCGVGLDAALR